MGLTPIPYHGQVGLVCTVKAKMPRSQGHACAGTVLTLEESREETQEQGFAESLGSWLLMDEMYSLPPPEDLLHTHKAPQDWGCQPGHFSPAV